MIHSLLKDDDSSSEVYSHVFVTVKIRYASRKKDEVLRRKVMNWKFVKR